MMDWILERFTQLNVQEHKNSLDVSCICDIEFSPG